MYHPKKTLIFELSLSGHRLEYLHHIYEEASKRSGEIFVFVIPNDFDKYKDSLEWNTYSHIRFVFLSEKEIEDVMESRGRLNRAYKCVNLLERYVKKEKPTHVLLIMLMSYMPFIAIKLFRRVKIRGIIYKIFLYDKHRSCLSYLCNILFYFLLCKRTCFEKLFVLNDNNSSDRFNQLFHTHKFIYLPDPVPNIDVSEVRNVRSDLGVSSNERLYLHFGGLAERKGTLQILKAINIMGKEELKDKVFVFAGVVDPEIKNVFYSLLKIAQKRVRVIVFDEFCPYNFINSLCESCDAIVLPYTNTSQSSGVIGYAAFFKRPIIGPNEGLLGGLIKRYHMGITMPDCSLNSIVESFKLVCQPVRNNYCEEHTVTQFAQIIMS